MLYLFGGGWLVGVVFERSQKRAAPKHLPVLVLADRRRRHLRLVGLAGQHQRFACLAQRVLRQARVVAEIGSVHIVQDQREPGAVVLTVMAIGALQLHRLFEPGDLHGCWREEREGGGKVVGRTGISIRYYRWWRSHAANGC